MTRSATTLTEGDSGTVNATFNISLSAASNMTVAVSVYSAAQDASKDVDYQTTVGRNPRDGPEGSSESCFWGLNPGPRPYQGRALPLSYSSTPFIRAMRGHPGFVHAARFKVPIAGEGNRTLVTCLEGRSSTIELHPRVPVTDP